MLRSIVTNILLLLAVTALPSLAQNKVDIINGTKNTLPASRYPVAGPSGSGHAQGAVPDPGASAGAVRYLREDMTWNTPSGAGTVTSVGLTMPGEFSCTGTPVTTSGTITCSWQSQAQNKVLAAPSGASGTPSFRLLAAADIPDLSATYVLTTRTVNGHQLNANITIAYSDLSGLPTLYYQQVQNQSTNVTQRTVLNMTGGGVACADAPGTTPPSTQCIFNGGANAAQTHSVAFSATPTFTATSATAGTVDTFVLAAMTANVTSSTVNGFTPGQILNFQLTQDATGGRTFAWPSSFTGSVCTVNPTPSVTTYSSYYVDASSVPQLVGCGSNETPSITRFSAERAAPTNCGTGGGCSWIDSTDHDVEFKNSSGLNFAQFLKGVDANPVTGKVNVLASNTGAQDFSGASSVKIPHSAGAAPTTDGVVAFDDTNKQPVWGDGTNTQKSAHYTGADPTATHCANWAANGVIADSGATCGGSAGTFNALDFSTIYGRDDFVLATGNAAGLINADNGWYGFSITGAFTSAVTAGTYPHLGVNTLSGASTTTGNGSGISWESGPNSLPLVDNLSLKTFDSYAIVRPVNVTNGQYEWGWSLFNLYERDGCIIKYDTANSDTHWVARCSQGGTHTDVDLGIAPSTTLWSKMRIYSTTAGTIKFSVCNGDGCALPTSGTGFASISTNVVTSSIDFGFVVQNANSTQASLQIDFTAFQFVSVGR